MLVALAVRMDEMADLREQLFDQHGLIQTQAVLGLLRRKKTLVCFTDLILRIETEEGLRISTRRNRSKDDGTFVTEWPTEAL